MGIMGGMGSRVSLANKCIAIFGTANVIIIACLLAVPWMNSAAVVQEYQLEVARQLADLWFDSKIETDVFEDEDVKIQLLMIHEVDHNEDGFVDRALASFRSQSVGEQEFYVAYDRDFHNYFQYAKPITKSQMMSIRKNTYIIREYNITTCYTNFH